MCRTGPARSSADRDGFPAGGPVLAAGQVVEEQPLQGVLVEAHLIVRPDQLADAGRERLELLAREPPERRHGHRDQGQPQLGEGMHERQDRLDLGVQRRLGVRPESLELQGPQRLRIAVHQQGQDDRPGPEGLIGQGLERLGQRGQHVRGVGELPRLDRADAIDHFFRIEAEDAAAGPDLRAECRRGGQGLGPDPPGCIDLDPGEVAVERRIDPTDALDERRMGGEGAQQVADGVAEEQVAGLPGLGGLDAGALGQRADLLEGPRDPVRIAGELHGGGVGQELALSTHGRLDQVAEEHADIPQDVQRQAEQRPGIGPRFSPSRRSSYR